MNTNPLKQWRRKQNRRTISMKPSTYLRLKELAESNGTSIAKVVDRLVNREADSSCVPIYTKDEAIAALGEKTQRNAEAVEPEGSHCSW